ncbi:hypothetical protein [Stutzerimonas nitrititolerans]|uniref:hypothetical protein n=1 Tax=Stutzerimonas nitrititolerans TaxID=2482751 RepID=UPI0028B17545|nr:hypothetical protein [Stutzerimonas nitrititolerans]
MGIELSAVLTAVATVLVAVAAAIGSITTGWLERRHRKRAIAAALLAEVSALSAIIRRRNYREDLDEAAEHVRLTGDCYQLTVPVPAHYCRVYAANLTAIGLLDPNQASKLVEFYQLVDSVVQDVSPGGVLASGTDSPADFIDAKDLLNDALAIAELLKQ